MTHRTTVETLYVDVGDDVIVARHVSALDSELSGPAGRPCVVMAHGIGATADCGLHEFADQFAAAGCDAISFDYRHFAGSGGEPRQLVSPTRQIDDYLAVVSHARRVSGIDPYRILVWGVSFSGGHVFRVAESDQRIAGVIALTPVTDGAAVVLGMMKRQRLSYFASLFSAALRDAVAGWLLGRDPVLVPIVAEPGKPAALNAPGAVAGMLATAGPTWRNAFAARLFLTVGVYRPGTAASRLRCPVLVQIADQDQSAPPRPAVVAAERARATVHHYPCDHFDVYPSGAWHRKVMADQVAFVRRVATPLTPIEAPAPSP